MTRDVEEWLKQRMPANCSFCGCKPHNGPCPGTINYGTLKQPKNEPCRCKLHERLI